MQKWQLRSTKAGVGIAANREIKRRQDGTRLMTAPSIVALVHLLVNRTTPRMCLARSEQTLVLNVYGITIWKLLSLHALDST